MAITTANVTVTRTAASGTGGTNWTVNVTALNLSSDVTVKDFVVLHNGVQVANTNYTKNSNIQITYVGTALLASTTVVVKRYTPASSRVTIPTYQSAINLAAWNAEFDRVYAILNEILLNGPGVTDIVPPLSGQTFNGVTNFDGGTINFTNAYNLLLQGSGSFTIDASGIFTGVVDFDGTVNFDGNADFDGATDFSITPTATTPAIVNLSDNTVVTADWVRKSIRPHVNVSQGSGQVVNFNTWTTVTLATEVSDVDNCFSGNTFTVPTGGGGVYMYECLMTCSTGSTRMVIVPRVNGAADNFNGQNISAATDIVFAYQQTGLLTLSDGNTVDFRAHFINTGSAARTIGSAQAKLVKLGEIS